MQYISGSLLLQCRLRGAVHTLALISCTARMVAGLHPSTCMGERWRSDSLRLVNGHGFDIPLLQLTSEMTSLSASVSDRAYARLMHSSAASKGGTWDLSAQSALQSGPHSASCSERRRQALFREQQAASERASSIEAISCTQRGGRFPIGSNATYTSITNSDHIKRCDAVSSELQRNLVSYSCSHVRCGKVRSDPTRPEGLASPQGA